MDGVLRVKTICVTLVLWISACVLVFADVGLIPGPIVTKAQCRAKCLQELLRSPFDDKSCFRRKSCDVCWNMCENIIITPEIFSEICNNEDYCQRGCQIACSFNKTKVPSSISWSFGMEPAVMNFKKTQNTEIAWETPTSEQASGLKQAFVYILMAKEPVGNPRSRTWTEVTQTASKQVVLKKEVLLHSSEFWLIAVTENGTATEAHFENKETIVKGVKYPSSSSLTDYTTHGSSKGTTIQVNFTIEEDPRDTTLSVLLEWSDPPLPLKEVDAYKVTWFMENCEVWERSPPCSIPADHFAHTVFYSKDKKSSYRINSLMYNTEYNVKVELQQANQRTSTEWVGEVDFKTDLCEEVDEQTYTKCKIGLNPDETVPETPIVEEKEERDPFVWYLTLKNMTYDKITHRVTANISWTVPFNTSHIKNYAVAWEVVNNDSNNRNSAGYENHITTQMYHVISLAPNKEYQVSVVAVFNNKKGDIESSFGSSMSEKLILNTSWYKSMPETPRTGMSRDTSIVQSQKKGVMDQVIYGVVMFCSICLLGLIMLFVYKKRHSFKDIIITKTAVAKSNSYKSNVGCKVDYSNQLLVISDEWELDPRLLKFSSPIGQGAFGKVVTGYYENQRVAIKLIRDSAPLSYKEDLLAEINLMKKIGSHPNIVSMSGACTLSEPIALVMEYVPYGNLQNFLKKCRLEGDFLKRIGRPSEVVYSLMDENGGIDSGVITPADMLSFARQVAMAMEYLAAKKYVHRDLAARNVLLGYNKVVKVCDFGLSRDIYNDNQYHKITSGKLPLKWMAIESLRDRIFTTQSDVWSFGILMWEIITMGGSPYPNIALADLYYVLANGYRMEKPSNCSSELYTIMRQCWIEVPTDRPNFTDLRVQIEQLLSRDRNYLDLDNIDAPLSTSESSSSPKSDDSDTMSLINSKPLVHRVIPGQSSWKQETSSPGTSRSVPQKTVTIATDPVTVVCIENSDQWSSS